MLLSFGQGSLRRAVLRRSGQQLLPDGSPPRPCQSALASRQVSSSATAPRQVSSCFPMLPHCLPCRVSRGAATLPHRLPLRSIPPPRFACGASHSRGTWASTVCAEEFPTPLEMSLHGLHLLRPTPIYRPICTDCLRHLRISAK